VSRISEAANRAQNMPKPEPSDGRDFYIIQARIRSLVEKNPDDALEWFDHRMERADIKQAESDALFYGRAIALQRKGDFKQARELLQNLIDRDHHIAYELQLADLDMNSGRDNHAIDRLAGLYHNFPGNHAISLQYAQALLKSRDGKQAETAAVVLRQQLLTHPDDPRLYELYAQSSNVAGDQVRAKEAIAESYYLRGGIHEAAMQLQGLSNEADLDYYERARITARINELRMELAKLGLDED
jgi:predicted Zn-dependent protease